MTTSTEIKVDHLSPSSISTYLDSPLRWYRHYVLGEREDDYNDSLHRGIVVHDVLEQRFRAEIGDFDTDGWDWHAAVAVSDHVKSMERKPPNDIDTRETAMIVAEYWERYGSKMKPLEVEMPFQLELPYAKYLKTLIGRIDLMHNRDGVPALVDFKTGRRKKSANDVEHDPQAIIYGLALRAQSGIKSDIHFAYHQLVFTTVPQIVILERPVTQVEMDRFEKDFLPGFVRTVEYQIESDSFYFNPNARYGTGLN